MFLLMLCLFPTAGQLLNVQLSLGSDDEVENYINQYKWNQDLMQNLVDDYEIVYPFQIKDHSRVGINTKNHYYVNSTVHFEKCTFVIKSSYGRFKLHMELNEILIPALAKIKHHINETNQSTIWGRQLEHCFYQGIVHGESDSKVTLSTCEGLHGAILVDNQTYFIVPMKGGDLGKRHPHMLIKAKWHQKMNCGNNGNTEWASKLDRVQRQAKHRHPRDVSTETKYVELAIVVDHNTLLRMEYDFKQTMQFLLEAINGVDLLFKETLKTRIALVYAEIWAYKSDLFWHPNDDIMQTLLDFIGYSSKYLYTIPKDATLFITSTNFSRHEISMASNGNICSGKSAGVVQFLNRFESFRLSIEIAHNLAHIIGVRHDQDIKPAGLIEAMNCECPERNGCLMTSKTISGKRNKFATEFSSCFVNDFTNALKSGSAGCLFNKPLEESSLILCGNKKVDPGEICDCGAVDECELVDPCCDPITCTLKKGAECGAGLCCDDCKIVRDNRICRPSENDCDVPEFCDSQSGQCPADACKLDGTVCGSAADGYCYIGQCQTLVQQCQALWGPGATVAEKECFEKLNMATLEIGIAKTVGNAMCSFLQCRNGNEIPKLPMYSKTEFAEHSNVYECKTASSGNKSASENEGMVKDGTKCLQNRICIDSLCVHLNAIAVDPKCPSNHVAWPCSGHGICTNLNWCYCNDGWSGKDCSMKLYEPVTTTLSSLRMPAMTSATARSSTSIGRNSTFRSPNYSLFDGTLPFSLRLETHVMLIILGVVAGSIFLLLLALTLCYKRKTSRKPHSKKKQGKAGSDRQNLERRCSASSIDTAHRSIRFGDMPSYRNEKFQMKRKKQHQHLLSRASQDGDNANEKSNFMEKTYHDPSPPSYGSVLPSAEVRQSPSHPINPYDQDFMDKYSTNKGPEKSILKNGPLNPSIAHQPSDGRSEIYTHGPYHSNRTGQRAACTSSLRTADGYESEPPYPTFRVFETSARKLNECRPAYYHRDEFDQSDRHHCSSVVNRANQRDVLRHYEETVEQSDCASAYAAYAGSSAPIPRRQPNIFRAMPCDAHYLNDQSLDSKGVGDDGFESPTFNIATPEPLKLDNIEYLLRELNRNVSNSSSSSIENDNGSNTLRNRNNIGAAQNSMSRSAHAFPCDQPNFSKIGTDPSTLNDSVFNSTPESNNLDAEGGTPSNNSINRRPMKLTDRDFNALSPCLPDRKIVRNNSSDTKIGRVAINNAGPLKYNLENHICSACQLPTPDLSSCDGRVSSDGSCDNNVCVCKLSSLHFKQQQQQVT